MSGKFIEARNEDGSSIRVYMQGAHLTSWRNQNGEELLYTSPNAVYEKGVAIRGGVPIIFPQFGDHGPLPSHGFARVRDWALREVKSGVASFTLDVPHEEFTANNSTSNIQQGEKAPVTKTSSGVVSLLYTITFSNQRLQLQMEVTNHVSEEVQFTFAFHTYFATEDIAQTLVNGVNMTPFIDNLGTTRAIRPPAQLWGFKGEVDRIHVDQKCAILLLDLTKQRTTHISGVNLPDVVIWNPWVEKTSRLKDLPADGYKKFACVEHAVIQKPVRLPFGGVWKASQNICLLSSSML